MSLKGINKKCRAENSISRKRARIVETETRTIMLIEKRIIVVYRDNPQSNNQAAGSLSFVG